MANKDSSLVQRIQEASSIKAAELTLKSQGIGMPERPSRAKGFLYTVGAVILGTLAGGMFGQLQAQTNYEKANNPENKQEYLSDVRINGLGYWPELTESNQQNRDIGQFLSFMLDEKVDIPVWNMTGSIEFLLRRTFPGLKNIQLGVALDYGKGNINNSGKDYFPEANVYIEELGMRLPSEVKVPFKQTFKDVALSVTAGRNLFKKGKFTFYVESMLTHHSFSSKTETDVSLISLGEEISVTADFYKRGWSASLTPGVELELSDRWFLYTGLTHIWAQDLKGDAKINNPAFQNFSYTNVQNTGSGFILGGGIKF